MLCRGERNFPPAPRFKQTSARSRLLNPTYPMIRNILTRSAIVLLCATLLTPVAFAKNKGEKGDKGSKPGKILKQYDTNGNGIIDGTEVDAIRKDYTANPSGPLKQFDLNANGKLDDDEIAAIKKKDKKGKK